MRDGGGFHAPVEEVYLHILLQLFVGDADIFHEEGGGEGDDGIQRERGMEGEPAELPGDFLVDAAQCGVVRLH